MVYLCLFGKTLSWVRVNSYRYMHSAQCFVPLLIKKFPIFWKYQEGNISQSAFLQKLKIPRNLQKSLKDTFFWEKSHIIPNLENDIFFNIFCSKNILIIFIKCSYIFFRQNGIFNGFWADFLIKKFTGRTKSFLILVSKILKKNVSFGRNFKPLKNRYWKNG